MRCRKHVFQYLVWLLTALVERIRGPVEHLRLSRGTAVQYDASRAVESAVRGERLKYSRDGVSQFLGKKKRKKERKKEKRNLIVCFCWVIVSACHVESTALCLTESGPHPHR